MATSFNVFMKNQSLAELTAEHYTQWFAYGAYLQLSSESLLTPPFLAGLYNIQYKGRNMIRRYDIGLRHQGS